MRIAIIILVIFTNVFAQLSLRKGMMSIDLNTINFPTIMKIISSIYVWTGLFLYGLSFILYLYIVSKFEVSYIYPIITSGAFILLMVLSVVFVSEGVNIYKALGLITIILGIWLMSK